MEKVLMTLHKIAYKFVAVLALIMTGGLSLLAFFYQARVGMKRSNLEKITFHRNSLKVYLFLALFVVFLFLTRKIIRKLSSKKLFIAFSAVYICIGVIFICGLGADLRADARSVLRAAELFSADNFGMMSKGQYLSWYPHQLGLLTYERIIRLFSHNTKIFFCMNFLFVMLINFTTWKISSLLFPEKKLTQNLTIILSFLFFPQLFFISFVYGTIPGFAMLLLASYFQLLFFKTDKKIYLLPLVLFAALSCVFKSNYLIGIIALAIVFVLESIKKKKYSWILISMALLILAGSSTTVLNKCYEKETGESTSNGMPTVLWVAMGLRDSGKTVGGWFDGFNTNTFRDAEYNPERASEIAKESIAQSVDRFKASPKYTAEFFGKKIVSTWCDPLYESLWTGPLEACNQSYDDQRLAKLYDETSDINRTVRQICEVIMIFMYAMSALYMVKLIKNKNDDGYLFGIIFFIGGVLFHLLWETKSQYVYPFVFVMIPYMANAFDALCVKVKKGGKRCLSVAKNIKKTK